jgi:hypothetical protein
LCEELGKLLFSAVNRAKNEATETRLTRAAQIKYFKEKRVMDYKRDRTLEQIAKEDAAASAKAKAERGGKSWFG